MRVYVETNFILEMAFEQEQSAACEELLLLAEHKTIEVAIPAFCFTEPHGRLRRQNHDRSELQTRLAKEIREFGRTPLAEEQKRAWSTVSAMLVSSTQLAEQRLDTIYGRLLKVAQVLPLTAAIVEAATRDQKKYGLQLPDALVLYSVMHDLHSSQQLSCFLNANSKDFDDPLIVEELKSLRCTPKWQFNAGLGYIRALLRKDP